jgi:hypothetical protein
LEYLDAEVENSSDLGMIKENIKISVKEKLDNYERKKLSHS